MFRISLGEWGAVGKLVQEGVLAQRDLFLWGGCGGGTARCECHSPWGWCLHHRCECKDASRPFVTLITRGAGPAQQAQRGGFSCKYRSTGYDVRLALGFINKHHWLYLFEKTEKPSMAVCAAEAHLGAHQVHCVGSGRRCHKQGNSLGQCRRCLLFAQSPHLLASVHWFAY